MSKVFSRSNTHQSIYDPEPFIQEYANSLPHDKLKIFERNLTRIILLKATACSILLICMNLSILLVVDSVDASLSYMLCTILSAAALILVYLIPSAYCAMLLTQASTMMPRSRRS